MILILLCALMQAAPPVLVAGNHNFEVEYQDHLGNVVFTETIVMTVKNYVQHEFTINLAVRTELVRALWMVSYPLSQPQKMIMASQQMQLPQT